MTRKYKKNNHTFHKFKIIFGFKFKIKHVRHIFKIYASKIDTLDFEIQDILSMKKERKKG